MLDEPAGHPKGPAAGPPAARPAGPAAASAAARPARPSRPSRPSRSPQPAEAAGPPPGRLNVPPWQERWPGRLDWEIAQLEAAGMRPQEPTISEHGVVEIDFTHTVNGVDYLLHATFPYLYPYFRPAVTTATTFDFHQEPFGGGLCLAARDPQFWLPEDSLASFVASQLPLIVRANADDDERDDAVEENVPEPVSENYVYVTPGYVLIDSAWQLPADVDHGTLKVGVLAEELPMRAAVLQVLGPDGAELAAADARLAAQFAGRTFLARWIRRPNPIMAQTAAEFVEHLIDLDEDLLRTGRWTNFGGRRLDLLAVVYDEEVRYFERGDDWVFLLRIEQPPDKPQKRVTRSPKKPFLVRAFRAGPVDMALRIPQLASLQHRRMFIAGLGALGAPAALALARAGIGVLHVLDADLVEPSTAPRWPHGLRAAGNSKVETIRALIGANWPYTKIGGIPWRLGLGVVDADEGEILRKMLDGVELIMDATANTAANYALSDIAWAARLPYVIVSATEGAWGGIVARLEPGRTGCFRCYYSALNNTIPLPPADLAHGSVTPTACSDTTFTGAGFDLTPLADEAVRIAVARLCEGVDGGYPSANWDVATLSLRDADGNLTVPTWQGYELPARADCTCGRA